MIAIKNNNEIEIMRSGGKILSDTLAVLLKTAQPGMSLIELDKLAFKLIIDAGARPSFLGYHRYPATICFSVNEGVVHGIPTIYRLREGDVVGIDLGVCFNGFHTDVSESIIIGDNNTFMKQQTFLDAGRKALDLAIGQAVVGNRVGDISSVIQETIEGSGYSIVKELTGHGVGRKLHEDPYIPGFGNRGTGELLKEGMTLAIEVIYSFGSPRIKTLSDGWTIVTQDGSWGGLFERTVAVGRKKSLILTEVHNFAKIASL